MNWNIQGGLLVFAFLGLIVVMKNPAVSFSQEKKLTTDEYMTLGVKSEERDNLDEAVGYFLKVLEIKKQDGPALIHLTRIYLKTGQVGKAVESAGQLVKNHPRLPWGSYYLGMAQGMLGDSPKAREYYLQAIKTDPKFAEAYFNLGFLSETAGRLAEASEYYQKTIEIDPNHARAFYNMGNVQAALDNVEKAIEAYRKAIELDPNYMDAYINLAILLTNQGEYKQAIQYLDEARLLGYEAPQPFLQTLEPYRH